MHIPTPAARKFVLAAACMATTVAFADCTSRKTRPAETAFNARAMAALVAALPPAPAGVVTVDAKAFDFKNPPAIYEVLCEGSKEGEFSITARRQYVRKHSPAERSYWSAQYDAVTAQYQALKKTPPDKAAEQQVLHQQSNAAWKAMRDAEKAGDKTAAQANDEKYRSLRNQANAIDAQHEASVQPQLSELAQRRAAIDLERQRVDVEISMNLQRLPTANASAVVGSHGAASPGKSVGLKVHNVAWSAVGADGTLRQTLAAVLERARLQALVGQPLPSEAESETVAANATPTPVPDLPASALAGTTAATAATASVTASPTTTTAAAAAAVPATPATPSAQPPAPPAAAEPVKKAVETVNKLRGLFGR